MEKTKLFQASKEPGVSLVSKRGAMQMKTGAFLSLYVHNECIFNMRCSGSNTGQYNHLERILLDLTLYRDMPPFHPPVHYGFLYL